MGRFDRAVGAAGRRALKSTRTIDRSIEIEVPFLLADPDKVKAWTEQAEELVSTALDTLKAVMLASESTRGDSAKVSAARTILEVMNLMRPSPAFVAQRIQDTSREVQEFSREDLLANLRELSEEDRQRLMLEVAGPQPGAPAPPMPQLALAAGGGGLEVIDVDPFAVE